MNYPGPDGSFMMPEYGKPAPFNPNPSGKPATLPALPEEEIKEALETYVSGQCCYSENFLKEMVIKDIQATPIYGYVLEFFLEKRIKEWVTEPYRGEYMRQETPFPVPVDIWSIHIPPPVSFGTASQSHTVPGSTSVVNCSQCTGIGNIQCGVCAGSMTSTCSTCDGTGSVVIQQDGETKQVKCIKCKGTKRTKCDNCNGKGTATCKTCHGFRRVKNYEKMEVNWSTLIQEDCHKNGGRISLNLNRLRALKKQLVGELTSSQPQDVPCYGVFRSFLETQYAAQCAIPHQRVLEIRQKVHLYPGTEVISRYDSRDRQFLIFGDERVVYFPEGYPQTCCSIM